MTSTRHEEPAREPRLPRDVGLGRGDGAARVRARRQSEDYDLLEKQGIDVRGKIVIVRYSNPYSYRGFKALTAERRGAAAMLILLRPAEDGYKKARSFPTDPGA